jgi:hypothetical protein
MWCGIAHDLKDECAVVSHVETTVVTAERTGVLIDRSRPGCGLDVLAICREFPGQVLGLPGHHVGLSEHLDDTIDRWPGHDDCPVAPQDAVRFLGPAVHVEASGHRTGAFRPVDLPGRPSPGPQG